jgi:AraC-like DNA-binding protein
MSIRHNWENAFSALEPYISLEGVHQWPFSPSCPVAVRYFLFDGYHSIRMNRHDYFEVFYIYAGKGHLQVRDRRRSVCKGELVVLGSTLYHRFACPRSTMKAIALYFQPEFIHGASATTDDAEYLAPFFSQDADFPFVVPAETGIPDEALSLIRRIHRELPFSSDRARLTVKTYLKMILVLLVNHYAEYSATREAFQRRQQAIGRLTPLFDYLEKHHSETIRVREAAASCAMSTSYFMRFFREVTGESFHSYLNRFRVAKAQWLLASSDKSISAVSREVGFCDQSHFTMVFRKLCQMTPLAYKRSRDRYHSSPLNSATSQ